MMISKNFTLFALFAWPVGCSPGLSAWACAARVAVRKAAGAYAQPVLVGDTGLAIHAWKALGK